VLDQLRLLLTGVSRAPEGHGIDSTIHWLVARELVGERAILDGDLVVEALPGRNRNLLLTTPDGPDLLVKLADELAPESAGTLRAEGDFFREHVLPGSELSARVPRLVHYDPSEPVLVFELL
jgi:hypothetical protein